MYEVAKELTRPRHCAVIRLDDRDGDAWLLADDKAARGDENGLILMVGVADLESNEIDRGMVRALNGLPKTQTCLPIQHRMTTA